MPGRKYIGYPSILLTQMDIYELQCKNDKMRTFKINHYTILNGSVSYIRYVGK